MRAKAITVPACACGLALAILAVGCVSHQGQAPVPLATANAVGRVGADRYFTPTGQVLTPAGRQVLLPGLRPQVLALSPDATLLAVAGKADALLLLDAAQGRVVQRVPLSFITTSTNGVPSTNVSTSVMAVSTNTRTNAGASITVTNRAEVSFTGLIFSPDGRRLYLANAGGNIWFFSIINHEVTGRAILLTVPETDSAKRKREIPSGLAMSADSSRLYVAGNLGNQLYEMEAATGKLLRSWDTGVAPYDVLLAGHKAYISNLGGRRPAKGDHVAPAGLGTWVRVDPVRDLANEGSVTVVDLAAGKVSGEILLELHPSGMALSPNGKYLVVANSGSDTLSVIDTRNDRVVEKIWTRQTPADLFGAQPNALTFDPSGERLYVCNGTQNAVAVIHFKPQENASRAIGLIPTGWFPGAIQFNPQRKTLCIANIKGIGSTRIFKPGEKVKFNVKDSFGTLSLVPVPSGRGLAGMTAVALENMRYPRLAEALLAARPGQPARPVPERVGEPSVFKHVIYVIKENRSYDQILGDMPEGNGDPALCVFGERYTPNQHKIARDFILLDNTYCSGINSSDGHQWTDSAIANEYVERQLSSGNPRSYTGGKGDDAVDALAWASSGFIWDNVLAHGKTLRDYGEWMLSKAGWADPKKKDKTTWRDFWQEFNTNANALQLRSRAQLKSLRGYGDTNTVGWDLKVPDVMRATEFIRELRDFETNGGFPDFIILFLPNDHTGGTRKEYPTPGAQIADNDLALGRVVEAVTQSRFWPDTCLFAIEDDPQAGWDHVSGYRTTCYVVSPYTRRKRTISTQYNQISLVRTMELILGLPPMNQMDGTATSMSDCFTEKPDFTPFTSVPNRVPLDTINPEPKKIADRRLRQDAIISGRLPLDEADRCPEDLFNHILWRAMEGPDAPYPEWAVKAAEDTD